jgi:cell shape-determining protein MreC
VLFFFVPRIISFFSASVLLPVYTFEQWIKNSTDALPQFFRDRNALLNELNEYKYAESAKSGDALTIARLIDENEELRSLLNAKASPRIAAGVIGRPSALPYDVLLLDQGSAQGVVEGAPVFIGKDIVIGFIKKVFNNTSLVVLVTSPSFVSTVYVAGPNIYTTAVGVGGGQLKIGVPQGIALEIGNTVILPGIDSGVYGTVTHVQSVPSEPEQYAYVSTDVPLRSLHLVSVGTAAKKSITFSEAEDVVREYQNKAFIIDVPQERLLSTTTNLGTSTKPATTSVIKIQP